MRSDSPILLFAVSRLVTLVAYPIVRIQTTASIDSISVRPNVWDSRSSALSTRAGEKIQFINKELHAETSRRTCGLVGCLALYIMPWYKGYCKQGAINKAKGFSHVFLFEQD